MIESQLGKIIIAVIVTVTLLVIIPPMFEQSLGTASEYACRNSVMLRSNFVLDLGIFGQVNRITPLVCNTYNEGTLRGSREQVKYQIADMMANCWFMYAEGRIDNIYEDHGHQNSMCNICYTFRIPSGMDLGSKLHFDEEDQWSNYDLEDIRSPNVIHPHELFGFLFERQFNRGLIYGGGTRNAISGTHKWINGLNTSEDNLIRYSRITRSINQPFIEDFSFLLTQNTRIKINALGLDLLSEKGINMFVVVAPSLDYIDRTAARRLTQILDLDPEDNKNSLLLMIDLEEGIMRLYAGIALENYFIEPEIELMLQRAFGIAPSLDNLNEGVKELSDELRAKILGNTMNQNNIRADRNSYMAYLSNNFLSPPPVITESINSDYTYAIAIVSYKEDNVFWGLLQQKQAIRYSQIAAGAGVGAAAGGVLGAVGGAFLCFNPIGGIACSTVFAVGLVGGLLIGTGLGGLTAAEITSHIDGGSYTYNNSIIISELNLVGDLCTIN